VFEEIFAGEPTMRFVAAFACAVILLCLGVLPGRAEKRVALVIGNSSYRFMPVLKNPVRDAGEVAAALKRLGFETIPVIDADARALNDGLERFAQSAQGAETVKPLSSPCGGSVSVSSRAAQPLSAGEECALKPKDVFKECDDCPEMMVVPAGSFTMGSPASEAGRVGDDVPQRSVTLAKPFAVGKFHITADQFAAFVADSGYDAGSKCWLFEGGQYVERSSRSWRNPGFSQAGTHPAVCVNWDDAKAYVAWMARKTGKTYRLLTEAEWEYAARGRTEPGQYPRYFFGDDEKDLCRYGNGADQAAKSSVPGAKDWPVAPCNDGYAYTSPVGSFAANGFGLYDMLGNAWQWTEDCYHDSYNGAPSDGSAWTTGDCSRRVLRGGSWSSLASRLRVADRFWGFAVDRGNFDGFRLGRTLTP
jgi:formylglycine-generating enzyme required for sulfatase activity